MKPAPDSNLDDKECNQGASKMCNKIYKRRRFWRELFLRFLDLNVSILKCRIFYGGYTIIV